MYSVDYGSLYCRDLVLPTFLSVPCSTSISRSRIAVCSETPVKSRYSRLRTERFWRDSGEILLTNLAPSRCTPLHKNRYGHRLPLVKKCCVIMCLRIRYNRHLYNNERSPS